MRLVSTSILLALYSYIYSQQVIIRPPIFSSFECTEFYRLYTGDVMNFSDITYESLMYLEVSYTNPNGRTSRLADGVLQGNPSLSIPPGNTPIKNGTYEFVYPNRSVNFYDRDIEILLSKSKCLPPGTYDVCLTLYEIGTTDFNDNYIAQTCYQREKVMPNQLFLVSPFEGDEVSVDLPLFTWTAIMPFNPDAMYRLQIVEVLANQTPYEAFRSNPIFYQESGLRSNIFQYPVSARPMLPCTNYAWRATYELDSRFVSAGFVKAPNVFQESEIWEFSMPCDEEDEEEEKDVEAISPYDLYYNLKDHNTESILILSGYQLLLIVDNSYNSNQAFNYDIIDQDGTVSNHYCCWSCCSNLEFIEADLSLIKSKNERIENIEDGVQKLLIDLDQLELKTNKIYTIKFDVGKQFTKLKFKIEL